MIGKVSNMKVIKASIDKLNEILDIFQYARKFMKETNNPNQWKDNRPSMERIVSSIEEESFYLIMEEDNIQGVFSLSYGIDPTYLKIDGRWKNDAPYVTIHSLAKAEGSHGIFEVAVNFAKAKCNNVRIDTHSDNQIMKHLLLKHGFTYCGTITVDDGTSRDAFQFVAPIIDWSPYKVFLVDYDGTIISSMDMWRSVCSRFVLSQNKTLITDPDKDNITSTTRQTAEYMVKYYFPQIPVDEIEKMMNEFVATEYSKAPVKQNGLSILKKLKSLGRVVLLSATTKTLLLENMKHQGISEYFDDVYSASELGVSKTDGSAYQKVLDLLGYKKEEALVLEDAPHAILGAKKIGISVLGVEDIDNQEHIHELYQNCDFFLPLCEEV